MTTSDDAASGRAATPRPPSAAPGAIVACGDRPDPLVATPIIRRGEPASVGDQAAAPFRLAVIALSGGPTDKKIVALAAELAKPTKAELIGVHVVEVDWTHPLDADIAGHSEEAQRVLDVAEATAEHVRYELEPVLLQARDVGAALVDEAVERGADLLVAGLPYRRKFGGDFAVGRTIPYLLKNAPCAVWVVREAMPQEPA